MLASAGLDLYFVCWAEGLEFSVRGIVSLSPAWSRGFRDFEICFVEFISWEQAVLKQMQLKQLKENELCNCTPVCSWFIKQDSYILETVLA